MQRPLETRRLVLRPFTTDDLEGWHSIWGDPEVIWWGAAGSLEESRGPFQRLVAHEPNWPDGVGWLAVRERGGDDIVGDVMLQPAPFVEGLEAGWHFRKEVWGRGYATEAAAAMIERGFADGVYERVHAAVVPQNLPSVRVAEKVGMRSVGEVEHGGMLHTLFVWP